MRHFTFIIIAILYLVSFANAKTTSPEDEISDILSSLSIEQKIAQLMIVGLKGKQINNHTKNMIGKVQPGGLILYGYNLPKKNKLRKFISSLQHYALKVNTLPMFISIDQEGGRVKRIKHGVTQFPGNMALGAANDTSLTEQSAEILALQLKKIGINMNFAPAIDINNNPANPIINTRSFGSNAHLVAAHGAAYIKGLQAKGVLACAKHFPGHGDTNVDSTHALPVIKHNLEQLKKGELLPFATAIEENVAAVMSAHISFPKILDSARPATLSKTFLTDILQKEMKFKGLIITDDLAMSAIAKNNDMGEAALQSVLAGADIILIATSDENIKLISDALVKAYQDGRLTEERLNRSVRKIVTFKINYHVIGFDKKNKMNAPKYSFSKSDKKLLAKANELNKELSQQALYFFKGDHEVDVNFNENTILISDNKTFNNKIKKNNLNIIQVHEISEQVFKSKNNLKVYVYAHKPDFDLIKKLKTFQSKYDFKLILISTGDPFLFSEEPNLPPTLFSFSNTPSSMDAVVEALLGRITPKITIPISLGLDD